MKESNPARVELFDTSLRDGMQQPNIDISVPNAVSLLQRMSAFGVHYAEIGFAGANQFVSDLTATLDSVDTGAMKLALFGRTRGRGAPRHPDGLKLALGVHAHATHGRQFARHLFENLRERGDGIAREEPATGDDHRLGDGLRSLEQAPRHGAPNSVTTGVSYLYTWNTKSGQICAHAWHPVHPGRSSGYR